VLVPGLAVSGSGDRLGQGGGCYDRALARVPAGTPVAVVLYDDEVGLAVPTDPHDVPVGFALTSSGVVASRSQG
jgi:5-formyltetrahydrofolate cyclo-ligase